MYMLLIRFFELMEIKILTAVAKAANTSNPVTLSLLTLSNRWEELMRYYDQGLDTSLVVVAEEILFVNINQEPQLHWKDAKVKDYPAVPTTLVLTF